MKTKFDCSPVLCVALTLASAALLVSSASGEESPYATGGEVTVRQFRDYVTSYIHVFTNTAEAATFASTGLRDLNVRYLVVGAGGAGGRYNEPGVYYGGGGGGGGGGVCEKANIPFAVGAVWQITVGKGGKMAATSTPEVSCGGTSTISNDTVDVETVPGGGGGASSKDGKSNAYPAQDGASGGGANVSYKPAGGKGTYTNSIFGVEYGPFDGGYNKSAGAPGSGGGGASEAGLNKSSDNSPVGGEGLVSDITGEPLVYGSGGGGGCARKNTTNIYNGGEGGTRAGNGAKYKIETVDDGTKTTNFFAATEGAANSGGGGGGGANMLVSGTETTYAPTPGADGIVVIRYDIYESPCEGGDIVTKKVDGQVTTWIHQFTDTVKAAKFMNRAGYDLSVRYLVVGAGGAGGDRYTGSSMGGGGGGGGGVCEKSGVLFGRGSTWQVAVGKGATKWAETAGASAISNDTVDVETVPGGGNGAWPVKSSSSVVYFATSGASGGGGSPSNTSSDDYGKGAAGTYTNSIFGVEYGPFDGGGRNGRAGGGGGGASAAGKAGGNRDSGGEGLVSDITGEELVYGSGGGAGAGGNTGSSTYYQGGLGGSRAGNGGYYTDENGNYTTKPPATGTSKEDAAALSVLATDAEPNSGGGGGGSHGLVTVTGRVGKGADGIVVISYKIYCDGACPCVGGDVVKRTLISGTRYIYHHIFTNAVQGFADLFINNTGKDLKLRYLVVGGGGGGGCTGASTSENSYSSGGGGGGGVREEKDVPFGAEGEWLVRVGVGAKKVENVDNPGTVAGASSISNGTEEVVLVPGGGNGASGSTNWKNCAVATDGAAGGGASGASNAAQPRRTTIPGDGTYVSSIFGVSPAGAPFGGGPYTGSSYLGTGGGGAGAAGTTGTQKTSGGTGGEGLVSDITGEPLVYGSGGGAGGHYYYNAPGGKGGTRAGNGATFEITDGGATTNFYAATVPAANSGCGGAGGEVWNAGGYNMGTDGADGVVIIRYIYDATPPGIIFMVR